MDFRNDTGPIKDPLGVPKNIEEMDWAVETNYIIPKFRDGIITVDKLLDHADVVLEWYIPSEDAMDFMNFFRLTLGEEPENSNPKAHYFLIDCVFQKEEVRPYFDVRNIDYDLNKNRLVVMCTREFSKSVLIGTVLPLYLAHRGNLPGFGQIHYALYVSDSMRNNVKTTMETIGSVYRESLYLQNEFEDARLVQDEVNFVREPRSKKEIALYDEYVNVQGKKLSEVPGRMKRSFAVKGIGASTGGRGSREALFRPEIAIFDDLLGNEADANSDIILENIDSTIESDILPALHGTKSFAIVIGTPYNKNDPVYKRIEDGSWLPIVFPKAEKMSVDLNKADFRGVWPDRHTYEACMRDFLRAKRAEDNGNPVPMRKLNQENYLRIADDRDRLVPESLFKWFNRQDIIDNAWQYNWYITTDYTTTGSKGSDYSGAALWAVNSNQDHFLIDLVLRKLEVEAQYNETFLMAEQTEGYTRGVEVGIEIDGQQDLHVLALQDRMPKRNTFFMFARQKGAKVGAKIGIRSKLEGGNKHWRFRMMLPYFQNGKIWFAKELKGSMDMNELLEEIKYTTYTSIGSQHDDGIDIISQLGAMNITYPSKETKAPVKKIGTRKGSLNAKIWSKKNDGDENETAYDSYA